MEKENIDLLVEGAKAFGIPLGEQALEAFGNYLKELLKWNQKINLTAIRSEKGIVLKHFLDSLSVHPFLVNASSVLDIGSGAGLPGIPLKIVQPSLEVTLIDSIRKKVDFQRHVIRTLGLKGIEAIHGRVQDEPILRDLEGRFDSVISRAFSDLQTFLRMSFPFLKKGGVVLAMKGEVNPKEIQAVLNIREMPYRLKKTASYFLPSGPRRRTVFVFEKG